MINSSLFYGSTILSLIIFLKYKKNNINNNKKNKINDIINNPIKKDVFVNFFNNNLVNWFNNNMINKYTMPNDATKHMNRMLNYTVPGGKLTRGLTVVNTTALIKNIKLNEQNKINNDLFNISCSVGWCIEFLQASFLVADDMMDGSITRRGKPCWYKNDDIGYNAINDALILLTQIDIILQKVCKNDFNKLNKLRTMFTNTSYQTELGQLLDVMMDGKKKDFNEFTMDIYKKIVEYKTAYYSFYAPIALGFIIADVNDENEFKKAREICHQLGKFFFC